MLKRPCFEKTEQGRFLQEYDSVYQAHPLMPLVAMPSMKNRWKAM